MYYINSLNNTLTIKEGLTMLANEEKKESNVAFYTLVGIIGASLVLLVGYLLYAMIF
jgi:hypothetical protein